MFHSKVKRASAMLIMALLFCFLISFTFYASQEWDPDALISVMDMVIGENFEYNYKLTKYEENSIRMITDLDMPSNGTSKDMIINECKKNKDELAEIKEAWDAATASLVELSKSGVEVLKSVDFNDKFFIASIVDDINDESSDVWLVIVNGEVVYDVFKELENADFESEEETEMNNVVSENVQKESKPKATTGEMNALRKAESYLSIIPFSYGGLVEQLEDYDGFSHEEAVYGAENCKADWNEQALKKAESYLDVMPFSYDGLLEQLENYDGFTNEEAIYGVDNCDADWNEQAEKKAKSYLDLMAFSRSELINQLTYEKFTPEQAEYAVDAVGY